MTLGLLIAAGLLNRPYHKILIDSARKWIEEGQFDVAIVFLQTACEVRTEQVFDTILQKKKVDWLKEPIKDLLPTYNISNEKVRKVYVALTGDKVQNHNFWNDFKQHVKLRNKVVHSAYKATKEEADRSFASVTALINHLEATVQRL